MYLSNEGHNPLKFPKSIFASSIAATFLAAALGCGSDSVTESTAVGDGADAVSDQAETRSVLNEAIHANVNVTVTSITHQGSPIQGAEVSLNYAHDGSNVEKVTTDSSGVASFSNITAGVEYVVEVHHDDYVTANKTIGEIIEADETRDLSVAMIFENAPIIWSNEDVGGTVTTVDGVSITFGPNALVIEESGEPVTGDVTAVITEVDVSNADHLEAYPGSLVGMYAGGDTGPLHTYGVIDINFYNADGKYLQLKEGQSAEVVFPISGLQHEDGSDVVAGDKIDLWTLDENTGVWTYDSEGTAEESAQGLVLRGTKTHFSAANMDLIKGHDRNYWNVMNLDLNIPEGEGFTNKPNCLAVKFWAYNGSINNASVSSPNSYVCADDVDKKQYFTLPNQRTTLISGYCWKVQMMVDGSKGYLSGGEGTIGNAKTFCQQDVRELINQNDCEHYSTNSVDNDSHCTTLSDHMGLDIQFGITYSYDSEDSPKYSILTPTNMTDYRSTSRTVTNGDGVSVTSTLVEGKKLNCQSVCESPLRANSNACTNVARDTSC